jgi:hypothetical protein
MVLAFTVYNDFFSYTSGVYASNSTTGGGVAGGHAVVMIGYGTEGSLPYYTIQNSWGSGWGDNGYAKMHTAGDFLWSYGYFYLRAWVSTGTVPQCLGPASNCVNDGQTGPVQFQYNETHKAYQPYGFGPTTSGTTTTTTVCTGLVSSVSVETGSWANEMSWTVGSCSSEENYKSDSVYTPSCCLHEGSYTLTCKDSYGDAWNGLGLHGLQRFLLVHIWSLCEQFDNRRWGSRWTCSSHDRVWHRGLTSVLHYSKFMGLWLG